MGRYTSMPQFKETYVLNYKLKNETKIRGGYFYCNVIS